MAISTLARALAAGTTAALLTAAALPAAAAIGRIEPVATQTAVDGAKKLCFARTESGQDSVTGTMLSRKVCKTRAQWEAAGVKFGPRAEAVKSAG